MVSGNIYPDSSTQEVFGGIAARRARVFGENTWFSSIEVCLLALRHNIRLSCSMRMGKKIVLFGAVGLFISLAIAGLASVAPGVFGWLTFAILVSASNCEPRRS
jgi:hypothetical protein